MNWQHTLESLMPTPPHRFGRQRSGSDELPPVRTVALMGVVLGSIGGGALIGAALTAFFTPTNGRSFRRKLANVLTPPIQSEDVGGYDSAEYAMEGSASDYSLCNSSSAIDEEEAISLDSPAPEVADAPGSANYDRRLYARE